MRQPLSRRSLLRATAATMGATGLPAAQAAPAPFKPTWDSLVSGYRTPDWFRDAKFGIWVIDADERKVLEGLGEWMGRNGEAIHGTRPWRTFGEGPTQIGGGMFSEGQIKNFTAQDIRFTAKAGALHAIGLAWPTSGVTRIAALAQDSALAPGVIERVEAVGSTDSLPFKRTPQGLEVRLPEGLAGSPAVALKISGGGLA